MLKALPDLLTASRLVLATLVVALGVIEGRRATPTVVILAMVAWTSDNLDGFIARRIPNRQPSWWGRNDFPIDVIFTAATLIFLTLAGFIPPWLGAGYAALAALVAALARRKPVTIIFLRITDVTAGLLVLKHYPALGLTLVAFLLTLATLQWPRFKRDSVAWAKTVWGMARDGFRAIARPMSATPRRRNGPR